MLTAGIVNTYVIALAVEAVEVTVAGSIVGNTHVDVAVSGVDANHRNIGIANSFGGILEKRRIIHFASLEVVGVISIGSSVGHPVGVGEGEEHFIPVNGSFCGASDLS